MIRLAVPPITEADISAAAEVLRSGMLVQAQQVAAFEAALGPWLADLPVVAVSSGTAALHLALLALDIGPGDFVATTAYSWPATANVIELCGAQPLFVDVDPATFCMNPARLRESLDPQRFGVHEQGRVKAILAVHAFGLMADGPAISEIAQTAGVPLIEDAACAIGSLYDGRTCGSWGDITCLSFHPRKLLTTGEGGAVATDDPVIEDRFRALRNHGIAAGKAEFVTAGLNYRLTEFQAALGLSQIPRLAALLADRRSKAQRYRDLLANTRIECQASPPGHVPNYQSFVVLVPGESGSRRDAIVARVRDAGVEVTIGTHHIPLTAHFSRRYSYRPGDFPATDDVAGRAVTLPLSHILTAVDQEKVISVLLSEIRDVTGIDAS